MRLWRQDKSHKAEVQAFIKAVQHGQSSPIPFEALVELRHVSFAYDDSMPRRAWYLLRYFGFRWLCFRAWYAAKQRSGWWQRRLPLSAWEVQPLRRLLRDPGFADPETYLRYRRERGPTFLFAPEQRHTFTTLLVAWDTPEGNPVADAERLRGGDLRCFEHMVMHVGFPPSWHTNPLTGQHAPSDRHWSQISDFDYGDIKVIWEPSRFGFVYALVRAYWRTGEERYAEWFWQLIEDWREHNPPQQGPNWKCGQETSLRVMAWCFGLYGFLDSQSTTAARVAMLTQMIALSGQRIAANLDYALSQRNNHGISESTGLWTIGTLFPEFRSATQWRKLGHQILETQGRELIYADGSFVQHSVNYQRLMLHAYLWCLCLGDLHDRPFSTELRERISKSGMFLYQIQDEISGHVPYYGQNDGALILPLSNCNYHDFRPVIQATHYLTTGTRCYAAGPWDEDLLWLFGSDSLTAPIIPSKKNDLKADSGGYYTLRSPHGFVFTRCATFQHRPGQADMLHVDLWWQGHNIALDAGTYSYNAPEPWDNPLARTAYHNTVTVDGMDQMERIGKFLWLPWLRSWVHTYQPSPAGWFTYWQGAHDGYQRCQPSVRHRRGILRLGDHHWLVLDALSSRGTHRYRLHWLFPDMPYTWEEDSGCLALDLPSGRYHVQIASLADRGTQSLICADPHSPRGWRATYYNYREPALSLDMTKVTDTVYFWTLFGPEKCQAEMEATTLHITTECWYASVSLQLSTGEGLITDACVRGAFADTLKAE